jgi:hypothetical protein
VIVGGALVGAGFKKRADLESTCGPTGTCKHADVQVIRDEWTAGGIAIGVGGASLLAATTIYLAAPKSRPKNGAASAGWSLRIQPRGAAVVGSF